MHIATPSAAVAVLATAAVTLGACGSPDRTDAAGRYCQELRTDKAFFLALDSATPDLTRIDQVFSRMHSLAHDAPPAVADDWRKLDTAVTTIEDALGKAGVKTTDLAALQKGRVPAGVDVAELAALGPKLQALSGPSVDHAAARIAGHARSACGVDLQAS